MGTFSRIALSSHARIFLAPSRDSIVSGAVDFMLVASVGGENQSVHKPKENRNPILRRMVASLEYAGTMIALLPRLMQDPAVMPAPHLMSSCPCDAA